MGFLYMGGGSPNSTNDTPAAVTATVSGLQAHWIFDASDMVNGSINDQVDGGDAVLAVNDTFGELVWDPDGDGQGIRIPSGFTGTIGGSSNVKLTAAMAQGEYTVEAWVKPLNLTQTGPAIIITSSSTTDPGNERNFMLGQGGYAGATGDLGKVSARAATGSLLVTGNGDPMALSSGAMTLGAHYHHIVHTYNGSTYADKIYIDGVLSYDGIRTGPLASDDWDVNFQLVLFSEYDSSSSWAGDCKMAAMYNSELSASEVVTNYHAGPSRTETIPTPTVSFVESSQTVAEGVVGVTITATLDMAALVATTVDYTISTSTGTALTTNYTVPGGASPLSFGIGDQTKDIVISTVDDGVATGHLDLIFELVGTDGNSTVASEGIVHTLNITDLDTLPSVSWVETEVTTNEADAATVTATLQLSHAHADDVIIEYSDTTGTASPGASLDYTANMTSPVTISAGSTTTTVTYDILDDSVAEDPAAPDTIITTITGITTSGGGTIFADVAASSHTITILDNDMLPVTHARPDDPSAGTGPIGINTNNTLGGVGMTTAITVDGTVVNDTHYTGVVHIQADNVTLNRCVIDGLVRVGTLASNAKGQNLTLSHCRIDAGYAGEPRAHSLVLSGAPVGESDPNRPGPYTPPGLIDDQQPGYQNAIRSEGSYFHGMTIDHCEITGSYDIAIKAEGPGYLENGLVDINGLDSRNVISYSEIHHIGGPALVMSRGVTVNNCWVHHIGGNPGRIWEEGEDVFAEPTTVGGDPGSSAVLGLTLADGTKLRSGYDAIYQWNFFDMPSKEHPGSPQDVKDPWKVVQDDQARDIPLGADGGFRSRSPFYLSNEQENVYAVLVENNWINGGDFSINVHDVLTTDPSSTSADGSPYDIIIRKNVFGDMVHLSHISQASAGTTPTQGTINAVGPGSAGDFVTLGNNIWASNQTADIAVVHFGSGMTYKYDDMVATQSNSTHSTPIISNGLQGSSWPSITP